MEFWTVWCVLVRKSPKLENPDAEVTIKSSELQKLLSQAYAQGAKHSKDSNGSVNDVFGIFGDMFSKKGK